jgi:dUTP pyrophosphatase
MNVRIRRLDPAVALPQYHSEGAAAFDLASNEDVVVAPGEVRLVGTGLVVEVPRGYFLGVVARSSLPIKKGLLVANAIGIVDSDYCGERDEVKVEVYNFTSREMAIARGERIAQGLILPAVRVAWEEVTDSASPSRGGFGSTGGIEGV